MAKNDSLVIFRKQLGDVLLLQPALALLAQQGKVSLATRANFADLLALMPGNISLAPRWLPSASVVYCLEARRGALVYAAQALGATRHLLLTRDNAPWWQTLFFTDMRIYPGETAYRAALYYQMVGGKAENFEPPRLKTPPPDWQLQGLPAAYGVIHPTAAWQRKAWAPERWIEALAGLGDGLKWVISSGPAQWEKELASRLATGLGEQAINLAGRTSIREYLALLANAKLTLCIDGSASHLSAAFGKPTLTLFGPTNPKHWHWASPITPYLSATDYSTEKRPPADAIPVAVVHKAIADLLEKIDV